jgi:hypothetical protein
MKSENWIEVVAKQVGNLRFGVVQIVVHDSRVVQIERTEKVRMDERAVVELGDGKREKLTS